jgi:hypothetical protein
MSVVRPIKRRRIFGGVAIAVAGAASSLPFPRLVFARKLKPVKFTLPRAPEASNLLPAAILHSVEGARLMAPARCAYDATVGIGVLNASSIDDKRPTSDSMITDKFTGTIKFTDAEWETAQKNSQKSRADVVT